MSFSSLIFPHIEPALTFHPLVSNRHPDAPPTALLRDAIDRKSDRLKAVLMAPALRKAFFNNCAADEKICVKRFVEMNMENALKTKPKVRLAVPTRGEGEFPFSLFNAVSF